MARTRPNEVPASTTSPRLSVPDCTSTVATGPRPLSRRASITMPLAAASTGAFSSSTSACSNTRSISSSMPLPVFADTETNGESPPYSSGTTACATSSCLTFSGLASCLSILLIATTMGTSAALAWWIASIVCGNHQHDDVGHLGSARAHRREGLMAGRVEERDHASRRLHVIGADVLGDAARLAGGQLGAAG